jgi:ABC-type branched-subunit amino acid transport system permease subunit
VILRVDAVGAYSIGMSVPSTVQVPVEPPTWMERLGAALSSPWALAVGAAVLAVVVPWLAKLPLRRRRKGEQAAEVARRAQS